MGNTKYLVTIFLNKKEEKDFLTAVRKHNNRETYSQEYHVEVAGIEEKAASYPAGSKEIYVYLTLACTDVVALFKFGEFWGNKTMQKWERELNEEKKAWPTAPEKTT